MNRRRVLRSAATLTTPMVAGCLGGDGGDSGETSTTTVDAAVTIELADGSFDPLDTVIDDVGPVRWVNRSDESHTVTSAELTSQATSWELEEQLAPDGGSAVFSFDEEGVYEYICNTHGEQQECGVVFVGGQFGTVANYNYPSLPCESSE